MEKLVEPRFWIEECLRYDASSHSYESYDSQVSYQSIGSYVLGLMFLRILLSLV